MNIDYSQLEYRALTRALSWIDGEYMTHRTLKVLEDERRSLLEKLHESRRFRHNGNKKLYFVRDVVFSHGPFGADPSYAFSEVGHSEEVVFVRRIKDFVDAFTPIEEEHGA